MRKPFWTALMTTFVAIITSGQVVRAQIVLKPTGQQAAPLRVKILKANVEIASAQFATTDMDLTFQNTQAQRVEADFLYTVPDGATVTDFAYYYGTERVVARVAEKERAAAIYQHITSRMRDPALVEMVGRNTFRARIFPVMPNADLRVQIRFVQVLPVRYGRITYNLPLKTTSSTSLDAVSVNIHILHMGNGMAITNTLGIPAAIVGDTARLAFSGTNYRPTKDLRVDLTPDKAQKTQARVVAAPSGGPNGFFALAVFPVAKGSGAGVRIAGVSTYDVERKGLAGGGLLLTGRYKNGGTARVVVPGANQTAFLPLVFGRVADAQNPASKIWAAARIARLSQTAAHRADVVALSLRFTLPSKYTSWIAIPDEERKRYEAEKNEAELDVLAQRLAHFMENKQQNRPDARAVRARFVVLCRKLGRDPADALRQYRSYELDKRLYFLGERLSILVLSGKGGSAEAVRLRSEFRAAHQQVSGGFNAQNADNFLDYFPPPFRKELSEAGNRLATLTLNQQENSAEGAKLRARFDGLLRQTIGFRPRDAMKPYIQPAAEKEIYQQGETLSLLLTQNKGATKEAEAVRARVRFLSQQGWGDTSVDVSPYLTKLARTLLGNAAGRVAQNIAQEETNTPAAQQAQAELETLCRQAETKPSVWLATPLESHAQRIANDQYEIIARDGEPSADLRRRFEALHKAAGREQFFGTWDEVLKGGYQQAAQQAAHEWANRVHGGELTWKNGQNDPDDYDGGYSMQKMNPTPPLTPAEEQKLRSRVFRLAQNGRVDPKPILEQAEAQWAYWEVDSARKQVVKAHKQNAPDPTAVQNAENHFVSVVKGDDGRIVAQNERWPVHAPRYGGNTPQGREAYTRDRIARIAARENGEKLDQQLADLPNVLAVAELRARRAQFAQTENTLRARMGDPLVTVNAPADARQVVALLPGVSEPLPLQWDAQANRWQARFDIPTYASEGEYRVTVLIVLADNTRQTRQFVFYVDITAPHGVVRVFRVVQNRTGETALRFDVTADKDTARIVVSLPGGETVLLDPVPNQPGRFFALVPEPAGISGVVTVVLTDRAHNRTTQTVPMPTEAEEPR